MMHAEALRCCYCSQLITDDDDAQRIDKHKYAHSSCAFAVNDEFFAALDSNNEETSEHDAT